MMRMKIVHFTIVATALFVVASSSTDPVLGSSVLEDAVVLDGNRHPLLRTSHRELEPKNKSPNNNKKNDDGGGGGESGGECESSEQILREWINSLTPVQMKDVLSCMLDIPVLKGNGKRQNPTPEPATAEPTNEWWDTQPPTDGDSIAIQAPPYLLKYHTDFEGVSAENVNVYLQQLEQVTYSHLEDFMIWEFAKTSLTNLDNFVTAYTRFSSTNSVVDVQWRSTGLFSKSTIFLPTAPELNELIESAFTGDNAMEYLQDLAQLLPADNPFSRTSMLEFEGLTAPTRPPSF